MQSFILLTEEFKRKLLWGIGLEPWQKPVHFVLSHNKFVKISLLLNIMRFQVKLDIHMHPTFYCVVIIICSLIHILS